MNSVNPLTQSAPAVTAHNIDPNNCDREQVQYPGAIQPQGLLFVLREPDWIILQLSANVDSWFGTSPESLLGLEFSRLLGDGQTEALRQKLAGLSLADAPVHLLRICHRRTSAEPVQGFEVFAHRKDGALILEMEAVDELPSTLLPDLYEGVRSCIARLQAAQSIEEFFNQAVCQVRCFTGFDRVHIYQFLDDRSGLVRAESKLDNLPSYLGLRFPATDVPEPARRLLSRLWIRHLPDAAYQPVPLVPAGNPLTGNPLDLSHAVLRSTSPLCNRFYLNMGVRATLTLTLLKEDRLWGFIACHHGDTKPVPQAVRAACESLTHMMSLLISARENAEQAVEALAAKEKIGGIIASMTKEASLQLGLTRHAGLADCFAAWGVAILLGQDLQRQGETPTTDQITALARWLDNQTGDVFATDRLSSLYEPAGQFRACGSGLLAIRLPEAAGYVLWFRPEQVEEVQWAGNPAKPVEIDASSGAARLGPRRSFELWTETVHGRSRPWHQYEFAAAENLRHAILVQCKADGLAHAKASLELSNQELARNNKALETFAHTAAHDLKEPLRGIDKYSTLLKESLGDTLPENEQARLDAVMRLTGRMRGLIDALLNHSSLGQKPLMTVASDMNAVVGEALDCLRPWLDTVNAEIVVQPGLPTLVCDPVCMVEVFMNLIANGIKYNQSEHKQVEIGWLADNGSVFFVKDNGIGIDPRHQTSVFEMFRRLHGRDSYGGGSGAGLAIVKKAIELHGGNIWVESELGKGSTFFFKLADPAQVVKDQDG